MLLRRRRSVDEMAYYRWYTTIPVALADLVRVAGRRWTVEEKFQTAKGCADLGQHQVRTWTSWYRWTTLVMLGHLLLVAATLVARAQPHPEGLVRLSVNESATT